MIINIIYGIGYSYQGSKQLYKPDFYRIKRQIYQRENTMELFFTENRKPARRCNFCGKIFYDVHHMHICKGSIDNFYRKYILTDVARVDIDGTIY